MYASTTVTLLLAASATVLSFDGARLRDLPVAHCAHGGEIKDGQCECTFNWTGPTCEEEVCRNGGKPVRDREGSLKCACPWGLKGLHCEIPTKCDNGGKLEKDVCACPKGFVGVFCESRPCHNGVPVRITGAKDYKCTCDVGFTGTFCEEELHCLNGGAVNENNVCDCENGFTGDICSVCDHVVEEGICMPEVSETAMAKTASSSPFEWNLIALVGLCLAVLVLVIVIAGVAVRSYRTKTSRTSSAQGSAIIPNPEGTDV